MATPVNSINELTLAAPTARDNARLMQVKTGGSSLNLRAAPSASATVLAKIANATVLTAYPTLAPNADWMPVLQNGQFGFVSSEYLVIQDSITTGTDYYEQLHPGVIPLPTGSPIVIGADTTSPDSARLSQKPQGILKKVGIAIAIVTVAGLAYKFLIHSAKPDTAKNGKQKKRKKPLQGVQDEYGICHLT